MATVVGDVASWMFGVLPFPGSRMPLRVDGLLFMVHIYTKREKKQSTEAASCFASPYDWPYLEWRAEIRPRMRYGESFSSGGQKGTAV